MGFRGLIGPLLHLVTLLSTLSAMSDLIGRLGEPQEFTFLFPACRLGNSKSSKESTLDPQTVYFPLPLALIVATWTDIRHLCIISCIIAALFAVQFSIHW